MRGLLLAAAAAAAVAVSPVPGFRPPAVPLFSHSPEINAYSTANVLPGSSPSHWTGDDLDFYSAARVDGKTYLLMGHNTQNLPTATQTSLTVFSTQTVYTFTVGNVALNMTFTSPKIVTDWELFSRPASYVTFTTGSLDGASHSASIYFDISPRVVVRDPSALVSWSRNSVTGVGITDSVTALGFGATNQAPLVDTNDRPSWGIAYLMADTSSSAGTTMVLEYSNTTRTQFSSSGTIPGSDNTQQPAPMVSGGTAPATGPQVGVDRPGDDLPGSPFNLPKDDYNLCWAACNASSSCKAWAYAVPKCDSYDQPTCWLKADWPGTEPQSCRVSGAQAGQPNTNGPTIVAAAVFTLTVDPSQPSTSASNSRVLTFAVDEILSINWFGESLPPYWRRTLPINSTAFPNDMMAQAFVSYSSVKTLCDSFDVETAAMLSSVGGDHYSTVTQLTYRQVFAGTTLAWVPSKQAVWYFLKEISSCGCLQTSDVIYPFFPIILYYSPELTKLMVVPHLEYASNFTSQPYPLPWAPHHLGYWPLANLPYTRQENMPLEETAWNMLIIASIAQRQGGDVTWLEPYWPVIQSWYGYLVNLLPFPQLQLSTDDFDGVLYNATNLAIKGIASMAAYGYIVEAYTGNATAAEAIYETAAQYASTMVDYSWLQESTGSGHFMLGYRGSQGDGGNSSSWPMIYNALWLRLLGYDSLLPNQASILSDQASWYQANVMQQYGLPLNSRKLFTKDDWQTFLAATYYTPGPSPAPSPFSSALFDALFAFANVTTSREPLSDWTNTDSPTAVGFTARPVYGAMYAPVLVAQGHDLGLGLASDPIVQHANEVFARTHKRIAKQKNAQV